jgi:hypothetical protein
LSCVKSKNWILKAQLNIIECRRPHDSTSSSTVEKAPKISYRDDINAGYFFYLNFSVTALAICNLETVFGRLN